MNEVLKVENLVVHRGGKEVLHGIELAVPRGEVTAVLGANGAGKSTLVLAMAGALAISGGTVSVDGRPVEGARPDVIRRHGIAIVPEGHHVLAGLSVADNLRAAGSALAPREIAAEIERALAVFPELRAKLAARAGELSGGQKQMVAVAQALIARPRYLLIDELSLGLAPAVVKRLAEVVREVAARGVGVLLIEQFTTIALALASRAYVFERGRVVFAGSAAELREKPEILHSAYLTA